MSNLGVSTKGLSCSLQICSFTVVKRRDSVPGLFVPSGMRLVGAQDRSFSVAVVRLWNSFPREIQTLLAFRRIVNANSCGWIGLKFHESRLFS